jgi:acyl carrier protein
MLKGEHFMAKPSCPHLSFEQFREFLAQELTVDEAKITAEASFIEDLLVDSIRMVEMFLRLEEEGLDIPLEAAWQIETVGDAYQRYVDHAPAEA